MDRRRHARQDPFARGSQEIRRIVDTHTSEHPSLQRPQRRPGRRQSLHQGAVETAVNDPVGLVMVGLDVHLSDHPVRPLLHDLDVAVADVVDADVEVFHSHVTLTAALASDGMQLSRYSDASPYQFGDLWLRELSPPAMRSGSIAEITLPIGVQRPSRRSQKIDRVYIGVSGEVQFTVEGEEVLIRRGDVIHIAQGEEYGFFNGGQQEARLLLFRAPAPSSPEES